VQILLNLVLDLDINVPLDLPVAYALGERVLDQGGADRLVGSAEDVLIEEGGEDVHVVVVVHVAID